MPSYEEDFRAEAACRNAPPGQLVEQAGRLKELASQLLFLAVVADRARGVPWEEIGEALGVTKAGVHKRFAERVRKLSWGGDADRAARVLFSQWSALTEHIERHEELIDIYCKMYELQRYQRPQK